VRWGEGRRLVCPVPSAASRPPSPLEALLQLTPLGRAGDELVRELAEATGEALAEVARMQEALAESPEEDMAALEAVAAASAAARGKARERRDSKAAREAAERKARRRLGSWRRRSDAAAQWRMVEEQVAWLQLDHAQLLSEVSTRGGAAAEKAAELEAQHEALETALAESQGERSRLERENRSTLARLAEAEADVARLVAAQAREAAKEAANQKAIVNARAAQDAKGEAEAAARLAKSGTRNAYLAGRLANADVNLAGGAPAHGQRRPGGRLEATLRKVAQGERALADSQQLLVEERAVSAALMGQVALAEAANR